MLKRVNKTKSECKSHNQDQIYPILRRVVIFNELKKKLNIGNRTPESQRPQN
jgi:hypothetical protein